MIELFELFRDGMVLQRDKNIPVWGWSAVTSRISLVFLNMQHETEADSDGRWSVVLPPAPFGGPYEMTVSDGIDTVLIRDILIGDVYLAGGQSNMELPLSRTLGALKDNVGRIHNPLIREFRVPIEFAFDRPRSRLSGGSWKSAVGENVSGLGAVAYFFAAAINERCGVPVGIVNASVGGSPVEAWLSEDALRAEGGFDDILAECKDDAHVRNTAAAEMARADDWYRRLNEEDTGLRSPQWKGDPLDDGGWQKASIPFYFRDNPALRGLQGSVWFRTEAVIPEGVSLDGATLLLGAVIDADEAFINGQSVGKTEYMYPPRRYAVPAGVLRHGTNRIAVRLLVNRDSGGFVEGMKYALSGKGWEVSLEGEWKYSIGAILPPLPQTTFFQYKPCGLHNAMLSPLAPYGYRGILWYQGESNDRNPDKYASRMEILIAEWRKKIGIELPFLFVQLANFADPTDRIPLNAWAAVREAQRKNLAVNKTAMAVIIDAGEANDLHPQDKKTVGERLALCARSLVYGENVEYSGPVCESAVFDESRGTVSLGFSHMDGGAVLRNYPSSYFELCGRDGVYRVVSASARGGGVCLECGNLDNPVSVRYAWRNNPEHPDLYNRAGLPASPFEMKISHA